MPPRSSRINAVVASSGSSRSARAAMARVAAAMSSDRRPRLDRHEYVNPLGPAGLDRPGQPESARAWRTRNAARTATREGIRLRGIEIQHEVGGVSPDTGPHQHRVVLDRPLVAEPQQRTPVVAQRIGDLAPGRLGPQRHRRHPVRRVLGHVLLHERGLAAQHPDHRQWPVPQRRDDRVSHGVQIVHQVALGRPAPSNSGWSRLVSDTPSRSSPLTRLPSHRSRWDARTTQVVAWLPDCLPGGTDQQTSPVSIQHGRAIRQYARRAVAPIA